MARARNIKPSFFQNEELGELSPLTRLAFIGMWTIADFKGCLEFLPKRLKVQLMPYDDCDFEVIASDLDKSGLIAIYSVAGQRYIKISNFEKHQNPHKNERESGSDIPDYSEEFRSGAASSGIQNNREENGTDPADSLLLNPSSLIPDSGLLGVPPQADPSQKAKKSAKKTIKTPMPEGFCISESVRKWAQQKGHQHLERHFESFVAKVEANGYTYANWDAAFRNAITDDWAKVRQLPRGSPPTYESAKDKSRRETYAALTGQNHEQRTLIDIN